MLFRIIHLGTGARLPYRFATVAEAQQFIDRYQVTQAYKDANYRILRERNNSRHGVFSGSYDSGL